MNARNRLEMRQRMKALREAVLLQKLRLCRLDVIAAMSASERPPNPKTLRELADLQLVIMATEGAIADKSDACFLHQFEKRAAAA
jgi:hypothetical protein